MIKVLEDDLAYIANTISKDFYGKTFFITGATGLIGSLIVKSLLYSNKVNDSKIRVVAFVRNKNKVANIYPDFIDDEFLSFIYGDIEDSIHIENSIDYIIHTASQTASKELVTHPVESVQTAVLGTLNILKLAKEKKIKGMVYLSSMEAFGVCSNLNSRLEEDDLGYIDLKNIRNCYPESKRMCELLCTSYSHEYNLKINNARLSQVFGAGIAASENRVFAQFTRSVIANENVVLHTDGTSWGNYCYTSDAITGIFTILKKGIDGETYTIVNESSSIQIKDMAQLIIDIIGNGNSKIVFDIPEDAKVYGYAPKTEMKLSARKIHSLGWKPTVSLKESFIRLIQWINCID